MFCSFKVVEFEIVFVFCREIVVCLVVFLFWEAFFLGNEFCLKVLEKSEW